jgi:glycosyltransferase involved in cell wall biosynthesis
MGQRNPTNNKSRLLKKNIVIVCAAGMVSGKEIITLQLLRTLKDRGHHCYVITSDWGSPDFKERLNSIGVGFSNIRLGFVSKTLSWPAIRMTLDQARYIPGMLRDYRRIIKKQDPDLIIHTNFHHLFVLYPVVDKKRLNIYWSHEFSGTSSFYRRLFSLFNKKITWFVGVSDAIGRSLKALVPNEKVVVIRNGINAPRDFRRKADRKPYPVIGIVGQVTDHKGHTVLLNALKDFRSWKYKPTIEIIGKGDDIYLGELHQLAKDLSLTEIISWRGFVSDPNEIYGGLDFIVVPTRQPDPYPTVIMEAAFRGIPAIVSDSGGLPEMVVPGVTGVMFSTGDPSSLASRLSDLPSEQEYQKWSIDTKQHAANRFSLDEFVNGFENLAR